MKRISLYAGMMALTFGLAACTEDYKDWAAPQSNAQQDALPTVEAIIGNGTDAAIVYNDAADLLNVAVYQGVNDPGITSVSVKKLIVNGTHEVPFTADGANYNVTKVQLDSVARLAADSRAYVDHPLTLSVEGTAVDELGQAYLLTSNAVNITYRPIPTPAVEDAYYLVGGFNNWGLDVRSAVLMDAVGEGVFEAVVDAPENCYWKVFGKTAVENANWDGGMGSPVSNVAATDGFMSWIEELGHQPEGWLIESAGKYRITFNAVTMKFSVVPAIANIYVPGNGNGWSPASAPMLSMKSNGVYEGFAYLDGDFKFTLARNWDEGEFNWTNFEAVPEGYAQGDGTNIKPGESGYYRLTVNLNDKSLAATKTAWGIVGPAQAGGWEADTDMSFDASEECWTATLELAAEEFKFRANDDWGINMGGSADDLVQDGGNLRIAEAGTYTVKLYLSRKTGEKYYCTIEKQ